MIRTIGTDVMLGLAVLIVGGSALGVLVMKDAASRLHFVTPAAVVAPALVALAVLLRQGLDENTTMTFIALFVLLAAGPYLSHATIRAIRVRAHGDWRLHGAPRGDSAAGGPAREREKTP